MSTGPMSGGPRGWGTAEADLRALCRGSDLSGWLAPGAGKWFFCLLAIVLGGALYGAALGLWRSPLQALYVSIKFPLLLLLTALGTALINGMLAQLLGLRMRLSASLLAVLMSFALLALLLAALTPLILFMLWHLPAVGGESQTDAHRIYLLANVLVIAFAGTVATLQLHRLLTDIGGAAAGGRVLALWLGLNCFLGAQLSWNLRPFFGSPGLPVGFLRDDPFAGSFFEAVYHLVLRSL